VIVGQFLFAGVLASTDAISPVARIGDSIPMPSESSFHQHQHSASLWKFL